MKITQQLLMGILAAGTLSLTVPLQAALSFDQNVTPDVIFGSGNANGFFVVDQQNGVELGLRAKVQFANTFNSNGAGTYTFQTGTAWNLEWSANSDYAGSSGNNLNALTYKLTLVGVGSIDPINVLFSDNSIGNNSTANGAGVEAVNPAGYAALLGANNVAQNSWQATLFGINPNATGSYNFKLEAYSMGNLLAGTEITVNAVPEPTTMIAGGLLLLPFGINVLRSFRKNRTS